MPRELIDTNDEYVEYGVEVGWQRDQEMQLGITVLEEGRTLLDVILGDVDRLEAIGRSLADWTFGRDPNAPPGPVCEHLRDAASIGQIDIKNLDSKTAVRLGTLVLTWCEKATGPVVERDGVWVPLPRWATNRLIKLLRRARDTTFGRDE